MTPSAQSPCPVCRQTLALQSGQDAIDISPIGDEASKVASVLGTEQHQKRLAGFAAPSDPQGQRLSANGTWGLSRRCHRAPSSRSR